MLDSKYWLCSIIMVCLYWNLGNGKDREGHPNNWLIKFSKPLSNLHSKQGEWVSSITQLKIFLGTAANK